MTSLNLRWIVAATLLVLIFAALLYGSSVLLQNNVFAGPYQTGLKILEPDAIPSEAFSIIGRGRINTSAYSPNGRTLATATSAGIVLYDAETYRVVSTIPSTASVRNVIWSPNSQFLAANIGSEIWLVDAIAYKRLYKFEEKRNASVGEIMMWSPDGKYLASVALMMYYTEVWIWDVSSGKHTLTLKNSARFPYTNGLAWSPDSASLAVSYRYGGVGGIVPKSELYLWDVSKTEIVDSWKIESKSPIQIAWAPDGKYLSIVTENSIKTLSIAKRSFSAPRAFKMLNGNIQATAVSFDASFIAVSTRRGPVSVYSLPYLVRANEFGELVTGAESIAWHPSGESLVASSTFSDSAYVWQVSSGELKHEIATEARWVEDLSWSPDNQLLAAGGRNNQVYLYKENEWVASLGMQDPGGRTRVSWSYDGKLVAWSGLALKRNEGVAQIWTSDGKHVANLPGNRKDAPLMWSRTENLLAIAPRGSLQVWRISVEQEPELLVEIRVGGTVLSVDWSPDGRKIVVGSASYDEDEERFFGKVSIWDASASTPLLEIQETDIGWVRSVRWATTQDWVAASFNTQCWSRTCGALKVWSASDGNVIRAFGKQESSSWKLSWSPDDQWVATTTSPNGNNMALYPIDGAQEILEMPMHNGSVESVEWSSDGAMIASSGYDGRIIIWDAKWLIPKASPTLGSAD